MRTAPLHFDLHTPVCVSSLTTDSGNLRQYLATLQENLRRYQEEVEVRGRESVVSLCFFFPYPHPLLPSSSLLVPFFFTRLSPVLSLPSVALWSSSPPPQGVISLTSRSFLQDGLSRF